MAIIKKYSPYQNLGSYKVFIEDGDPDSLYFNVTELEQTLTGGKNSFLFEGSTYLKKGSKIYVEGQLRTNSWEDKNTGEKKFRTEIVAREMQMLSSRGEMSQQNQDSGFDQSSQNSQEESVPWDDEDIPF